MLKRDNWIMPYGATTASALIKLQLFLCFHYNKSNLLQDIGFLENLENKRKF